MPDIEWSESVPPATESAGLGAQRIQSLKTAIRTGLDAEHNWPTSGLGAGVHRLGSARAYYGAQSLVSSSGTDGRLMVASDTSRLFHVGSAGTMLLGGNAVLSVGSQPVGGQRFYWAMEFGQDSFAISQTAKTITIPNSGFSGSPFVFLTPFAPTAMSLSGTPTATQFSALLAQAQGQLTPFHWLSIGTRTL